MRYAYSLELKRQKVIDALERVGCLPPRKSCRRSVWKIRCGSATRPNIPLFPAKSARFSLQAAGLSRFKIVCCSIPRSVQALIWLSGQNAKGLSYLVTRVNRAGQLMVILCGALPHSPVSAFPDCDSFYYCHLRPHPAHALDGVCQYIAGEKTLCERLSGLEFSISPQSFFSRSTPCRRSASIPRLWMLWNLREAKPCSTHIAAPAPSRWPRPGAAKGRWE